MLLFTAQKLNFEPWRDGSGVGRLQEPEEKYLIIDGQHRLAALQFYERSHPGEAKNINVPCVIFDGRSEDFATEMFVIINSTTTRINKSHLVDLYERVSWAEPDRRFAAHIAEMLYREADSPLRYRINRLGGRSKQEKWILQAELFNEIHRWVKKAWAKIEKEGPDKRLAARYYASCAIFSRLPPKSGMRRGAIPITWLPSRSRSRRCCGCAPIWPPRTPNRRKTASAAGPSAWALDASRSREFRNEGFYERFPAKGQVERVVRVHRELAKAAGVSSKSKAE